MIIGDLCMIALIILKMVGVISLPWMWILLPAVIYIGVVTASACAAETN